MTKRVDLFASISWLRLAPEHHALEGGDEKAQQCGWLKDKYGLSWQVVPTILPELLKNPRAMEAMLQMKKIDIEKLKQA